MKRILAGLWLDWTSRFGMIFLILAVLLSVFAYPLSTVKQPFANEVLAPLALVEPGTKVLILHFEKKEEIEVNSIFRGYSLFNQSIPVSSCINSAKEIRYLPFGLEDKGENWKLISKPVEFQLENRVFYLGSDRFGRDLYSRLLIGSRISLAAGLIAVVISLLIGVPLGALAGYYGGWIDRIVSWFFQVVWSIPTLLLVIALTLALGKGFWQVFVAIGLTMWVEVARVVRGEVLNQSVREYVTAARIMGFRHFYVLNKHVLPNSLAPLLIISSANFASAILVESGLSFLGLGAQPPIPSWGNIIKDHYVYIIMGKPHLAIVPGVLIVLLVLSFMTIGNKLRDLLDTRALLN